MRKAEKESGRQNLEEAPKELTQALRRTIAELREPAVVDSDGKR